VVIVTMDIWRVPTSALPRALLNMARHRRRIRGLDGCTFAKLLGTGTGERFTVSDADLHQWAVLAVWDQPDRANEWRHSRPFAQWARIASEHAHFDLDPIASTGAWSKKTPFTMSGELPDPRRPIAAITRARLRGTTSLRFWRAVPPVTMALHSAPGLMSAIGIGEAPIGLQGTFSLWESANAIRDFAYRDPAHLEVVRRTHDEGWYSEELFARFAVREMGGVLRGRSLS
jgi:heme-degrading monooxygenase HmoA